MFDDRVELISMDSDGCKRLSARMNHPKMFDVLIRPRRMVSCDERV